MRRIAIGLALALVAVLVPGTARASDPTYPVITVQPVAAVDPGAEILAAGTLVRSDGAPYVGVELQPWYRCLLGGNEGLTALPAAVTDEAGGFVLGPLTAGACDEYELTVRFSDPDSDGYAEQSVQVVVNRAATTLRIDVPAAALTSEEYVVTVHAQGPGEVPLAGEQLQVERRVDSSSSGSRWVITDEAGEATFTDSHDASADLTYRVDHPGSVVQSRATVTSTAVQVRPRPTSTTLDPLPPAVVDEPFQVSGMVTDAPLPATVLVQGPEYSSAMVTTDLDGHFEASIVSHLAGTREIRATYLPATTLHARSEGVAEVTLPLKAASFAITPVAQVQVGDPVTVSGRLVGTDRPVPIAVRLPDDTVTSVSTDADGDFSVTVDPGFGIGSHSLDLSFAGSERNSAAATSVAVPVVPRAITLGVNAPAAVEVGQSSTVAGSVAGLSLGATKVTLASASGAVVATRTTSGAFSFSLPPAYYTGATSYVVKVGGAGTSYAYRSRSFTVQHKVKPRLLTQLLAARRRVKGVSIYRRTDDPLMATLTSANYAGTCHRYRVQRVLGGVWTTVRRSACVPLNRTYGETRWRWRAAPRVGVTYRVVVSVNATSKSFAGTSSPRYLRFR